MPLPKRRPLRDPVKVKLRPPLVRKVGSDPVRVKVKAKDSFLPKANQDFDPAVKAAP